MGMGMERDKGNKKGNKTKTKEIGEDLLTSLLLLLL